MALSNTEKVKLFDKVRWLAEGPNSESKQMKQYVVNGTKFQTKDYEENKKTQNSGVSVTTEGGITYYGVLSDIIDNLRYILFKCDWVDVDTGRGTRWDLV